MLCGSQEGVTEGREHQIPTTRFRNPVHPIKQPLRTERQVSCGRQSTHAVLPVTHPLYLPFSVHRCVICRFTGIYLSS